jgi:hypothetical protein
LQRITPVGLDPIARLAGNERWRNHAAFVAQGNNTRSRGF